MPEIIRASIARKFACSTPSGASASTDIRAGASIIDAAACAEISASPVVGWTPSANAQVSAPFGSRSVDGVQASALAVVHTGVVTFTKPNAAGFATISFESAKELTCTTWRLAAASPAFSVELNKPESAVNVAFAVFAAAIGALPISGTL